MESLKKYINNKKKVYANATTQENVGLPLKTILPSCPSSSAYRKGLLLYFSIQLSWQLSARSSPIHSSFQPLVRSVQNLFLSHVGETYRLPVYSIWSVRRGLLKDPPSGSLEIPQPSACLPKLNKVPAHLWEWVGVWGIIYHKCQAIFFRTSQAFLKLKSINVLKIIGNRDCYIVQLKCNQRPGA